MVAIGSLNVYAVIRLFQLKVEAVNLLFLTTFANILTTFCYAIWSRVWIQSMLSRPDRLAGFLIGQFLTVLVCVYAFRLKRRGVLT